MSSASPGASHRKCTRRPGRKAATLRPDLNTSVTAGVRVVKLLTCVRLPVLGIGITSACFHASGEIEDLKDRLQ